MDIGNIRKDFNTHEPLKRSALDPCPITQFAYWFQLTLKAEIPEPNAFVLATATPEGSPSQRSVLLKYFDQEGFVFYSNYQSRKAQEMAENPHVSALFPWFSLQRQVRIEGRVEKVSREQSLKYFLSRPRDSQIGAWCSPQSSMISSRQMLLSQWEKMKSKFAEGDVPLPDFWGGYRIRPSKMEFWQGQKNRLHDRFLYDLQGDDWQITRLAP